MSVVRHSLRSLLRAPVYTLSAVLTLALGLGANAVVAAIAGAVFVRPLPFARERELVAVQMTYPDPHGTVTGGSAGELDYVHLGARTRTLRGLGAMLATTYAVVRDGEAVTVDGAGVSATMWEVLGARPVAGRTWDRAEDRRLSDLAVIGEALQRRWFPGPPASALGRTLVVDGRTRTIVGVMPAGFAPYLRPGDLWVPLGLHPATVAVRTGTRFHLLAGRLRPGVTVAQAGDDLARIARQLERELPTSHHGWGTRAVPLRQAIGGDTRATTVMLVACVALLLVLAGTNVAHLSLARLLQRRAELSSRLALGAPPASLVWRQVVEGALLGAAGGAVGAALCAVALGPLLALVPDAPPLLARARLDGRVALVVALLSLATGVAAALGPALVGVRRAERGALAGGGRLRHGGARDRRLRAWLAAAQLAAAALLLVTSLAIAGAMWRLGRVDTGLDARGVVVGRLTLPARYDGLRTRNQLVAAVLDRLTAEPGVRGAGMTQNRFVAGQSVGTVLTFEGRPASDTGGLSVELRRVTPGYFAAVGIRPLRGRLLDASDRDGTLPVVVVSRALARRYFGTDDAVGRRIRRTGGPHPWLTIVGVAPDVRDAGVAEALGPTIYMPYAQSATPSVTLVVRSALPPERVDRAIRAAVRAADPLLAVDDVAPLTRLLEDSLGEQRLRTAVLGALAALALALASAGIYGVTAFLMAERTREIALRMALGAAPGTVLARVVADGGRWIAGGVGAGLAAAWGVGAAWRATFPELGGAGVTAYLGAAALLVAVSLLATWLPARRASRLAPALVLRGD
jgi:predicted permease